MLQRVLQDFKSPLDWDDNAPRQGDVDGNKIYLSPLSNTFALKLWEKLEDRLLDHYANIVVSILNNDSEDGDLETVLHNVAMDIDTQVSTTHPPVTEEFEAHLGDLLANYIFNDNGDAIKYAARIDAWIDLARHLYFSRITTAAFCARLRQRINFNYNIV